MILAAVRKEYWIPQGRRTVQSILKRCYVCIRNEGGPYKTPAMPPWPHTKTMETPAFNYVGTDYFGPFRIKENTIKMVWIILFNCETSRAIHLEVLPNLTTTEFILCLKRFIARRSKPEQIRSDNASQFKLASKFLDDIWKNILNDETVYSYLSTKGILWKFSVAAPWMGGFYERIIADIKRALNKTIGRKVLTYSQFQTLATEIEGVLNSRPLTYVEDDTSTIVLTPAHFITINPKLGVPARTNPKTIGKLTNQSLLYTWKKGNGQLNEFWRLWRDMYLLSLRERGIKEKKQRKEARGPQLKDVVLIKDDDLPRGSWRIGIVVELITSQDGQVRSAKVRLSNRNVLQRPVNKLYPVEGEND